MQIEDKYLLTIRREVVNEVALDLLQGAEKAMKVHGKDPDALAILVLAFEKAIRNINDRIAPSFWPALLALLKTKV